MIRGHGIARMLVRLLVVAGLAAVLFGGWRVFLRYGPARLGNGASAMFPFHARLLLQQRAGFPRPGGAMVLPVPRGMASADVQLRLMEWRDGKGWLPAALAHGQPGRSGLRIPGGQLVLTEVVRVGAAEVRNGRTTCKVVCRVRWDLPAELQELLRVRQIVGLRMPKGLAPGQTSEIVCRFVQDGWNWELDTLASPWGGTLEPPVPIERWKHWLF